MRSHITLIILISLIGCKKTGEYSEIKKSLEKVMVDDQKYRYPTFDPIKQHALDKKNLKVVTKIIDSLGWLGKDKIGKEANEALFATIQHADNLSIMEKYLSVMKEAAKNGNAEKRHLAYLIDRVEIYNNRKQIYGTQPSVNEQGKTYIENLIDPSDVDIRRKSMDLDPIENYIRICDSINLNTLKPVNKHPKFLK